MKKATLRRFATLLPQTVDENELLSRAMETMKTYKIRHLPVTSGERLTGILSERAAKAASLSKWGDRFLVKDVMISEPYTVKMTTPLHRVIDTMIREKFGSAVVVDNEGDIQGIFTTTDALKALKKALLKTRKRPTIAKGDIHSFALALGD